MINGDLAWMLALGMPGDSLHLAIQMIQLFGLILVRVISVLGNYVRLASLGSAGVCMMKILRPLDLGQKRNKMMKSYIYGFLGCTTALVLYLYLYSQYSDYRDKVEVNELMFRAESVQREVEDHLKKAGNFDGVARKNRGAQDGLTVFENGIVILNGRRGQLLVLIPKVGGDRVLWGCYVGPERAKPVNCRSE